MDIRQLEPRPDAKEGLATGDRLFHFFVKSSEGHEYFVALHRVEGGGIRSACQCMSAVVNLVRSQNEPCCKHAAEAMKIVKWELSRKG